MLIVELLIQHAVNSLNRPFSYTYEGSKPLKVGTRVIVPFNNQELVGYVLSIKEDPRSRDEIEESIGFTLLNIIDVIDEEPLLNEDLLQLVDKISSYYLAPKIAVLQAMLPPSLAPRKSSLKGPKIAYEQYVEIKEYSEEDLTGKQIEMMRLVKELGRVLKKELSPSILSKLVDKGLLQIVKEEKRRLDIPTYDKKKEVKLTEEQQKVVDEFNASSDLIYLLEGVTGSGKTEVYLKLSEQTLKEGKSVLMLVPEISLTPMMVEYFLRRFEDNVAILHSELTPAEKYDEYRKIAKGECKVVVGARSAIFAPLKNIGLIILDEEHTESYKQDTALPFYHAREVGIMRSKMHNAKIVLGSATPSLETRARGQTGRYHMLRLTKRVNNHPLPKTTIVNMLDYKNIDRESYIFSFKLRNSIRRVLDNKEQAILLINRRGFATTVSCRSCGTVMKCPTCGIALTYHKADNMLKCHHCDYVQVMPKECPECGSKYIMKTGFGTERIEEEVHRLFPEARTLRLDSDSAKIRTRIPQIIESFRKKEADILIGTQMIAKGHDFPDVTLVGIVLADIGLSMPSYRSSERAFELITQAVGRSGRSDKKGEAIIQTYMPTHYAITMAARQDYEAFFLKEVGMRKIQYYPPYCYLASVTISGKNEDKVIEYTYKVVDFLNEEFKEEGIILGPSAPYIAKEQNNHIRQALIKFKDHKLAHSVLEKLLKMMRTQSGINVYVDIDPYNF